MIIKRLHLLTVLVACCLTALEADGARRLWNESFFSAPQLKRDSLDGGFFSRSGRHEAHRAKHDASSDHTIHSAGLGWRGPVRHRHPSIHIHHIERSRHSAHRLGGLIRSSYGRARVRSVPPQPKRRGYTARSLSDLSHLVLPADRFTRLASPKHHFLVLFH